jgi:hypothetical protein
MIRWGRLGRFLVFVVLGAGALVLVRAVATMPDRPVATAPSPTPDPCPDAINRVQTYTAPGDRFTVMEHIAGGLSAEQRRRPVQLGGWGPVEVIGPRCWVTFRATVGNEPQRYTWELDPRTGAVSARDDATKRLSGW